MEYAGKQGQCKRCGTSITPQAQRRVWRFTSIASGLGVIVAIVTLTYAQSRWNGYLQSNATRTPPKSEQESDAAAPGSELASPPGSGLVELPHYEVLETNVEDSLAYATAHRYILITGGDISRENLEALLAHETSKISELRGPKYHEPPSKLGIRVYSSRAHWESKNQRAVAWLFRDALGKISAEIDDVLIAEYHANPTTRFGLTEEQRKAIWADGCYAERAATKAAEQAFPWPDADEADPVKWEEFFEVTRPRQSDLRDRLMKENDQSVIDYYAITEETYDAITNEGLERGWPLPPE